MVKAESCPRVTPLKHQKILVNGLNGVVVPYSIVKVWLEFPFFIYSHPCAPSPPIVNATKKPKYNVYGYSVRQKLDTGKNLTGFWNNWWRKNVYFFHYQMTRGQERSPHVHLANWLGQTFPSNTWKVMLYPYWSWNNIGLWECFSLQESWWSYYCGRT